MGKIFKNIKLLLVLISIVILITYISYCSSYNFNFEEFGFIINLKIKNYENFWLSFSAIITFLGILAALFKENIYNFLHKPDLKIEVENKGTIFEVSDNIKLIYHIKVINKNYFNINDVEFYYESIVIDNSKNLLDIRRPMAWARSEENREKISIYDYDHLDFIYAEFDLKNETFSYRIISKYNNWYKSIIKFEEITKESEIEIIPTYYNQKDLRKYLIKIVIDEKLVVELKKYIEEIKTQIQQELECLMNIQKTKEFEQLLNDDKFNYLNIIFYNIPNKVEILKDWSPMNYGHSEIETCINDIFISNYINNLYYHKNEFQKELNDIVFKKFLSVLKYELSEVKIKIN